MKYGLRKIGVLFVSVMATGLTHATVMTSANLVETCQAWTKNTSNQFYAGACKGYMEGFVTMDMIYAKIPKSHQFFCLPANNSELTMANTFLAYMKANPDKMNQDANASAVSAFTAAWPCTSNIIY